MPCSFQKKSVVAYHGGGCYLGYFRTSISEAHLCFLLAWVLFLVIRTPCLRGFHSYVFTGLCSLCCYSNGSNMVLERQPLHQPACTGSRVCVIYCCISSAGGVLCQPNQRLRVVNPLSSATFPGLAGIMSQAG